jgi:RHS repeat-associated protein
LTDENGKILWECSFQLWGKRIHEIEHDPIEQNLRYQGQYLDRETGLHYNTFRYYDPDIGRFTQPDPIGLLGGFNLYQYAPNGLTWIDPWGLSCKVRFKRWKRGDAIDKPLPNGDTPSWNVVRTRYWKNRYEALKGTSEFNNRKMGRMKKGNALLDENGNPMELHHHNPQRNGGRDVNNPVNLREVTREQHATLDKFRQLGGNKK